MTMTCPGRAWLKAAAFGALMTTLCATSAHATRLWDPYLRGVNEGVPAGALPPPGVYGVLNNYWASYSYFGGNGRKISNTGLSALVEVPVVLWVPGVRVLGATYAAGIAQPFDYNVSPDLSGKAGPGNWGTFNTVLIPGLLSWQLPDALFVKAGLEFQVPDASSTMATTLNNGGLPSGNGYGVVQPDLGVSYLGGGWNVSAEFHLDVPLSSDHYNGITYRSGTQFSADYTIAKTMGPWTLGLGLAQENQLNADTRNGAKVANSEVTNFGMGPLVGYQFSNFGVLAEWNHNLHARNDVAGDIFNVRLTTRF
ncbi:transporter [Acidocella sp.]|uniref:SphA family protein n=1 Tax=Acidocella sp. TaxID=50710 RepID=UPI002618E7D3|nr:transporter [Acidocella sp.]